MYGSSLPSFGMRHPPPRLQCPPIPGESRTAAVKRASSSSDSCRRHRVLPSSKTAPMRSSQPDGGQQGRGGRHPRQHPRLGKLSEDEMGEGGSPASRGFRPGQKAQSQPWRTSTRSQQEWGPTQQGLTRCCSPAQPWGCCFSPSPVRVSEGEEKGRRALRGSYRVT